MPQTAHAIADPDAGHLRPPARILVAGGQSRAARAFRHYAAAHPSLALTTMIRRRAEPAGAETLVQVGDYFNPPLPLFERKDAVINFAGLARGRSESSLRRVNVDGPAELAAKAKRHGVRHFIHLSSLHVYGAAEDISLASREAPVTAYGRSKLAADRALLRLADDGFTVTLLRVPILYGRRFGGNIERLATAMARLGWFAVPSLAGPRSVLHADNLAIALDEVVRSCLGGVRLAADPEPFTIELLADVLRRKGRAIRLVRLPDLAFLPLRVFANRLYSRLYCQNLVAAADCIALGPGAVVPRTGLEDIVF